MRTRCIGTPLVSALQNKPLGAARVLLDHMGDIPIKVGERRAESGEPVRVQILAPAMFRGCRMLRGRRIRREGYDESVAPRQSRPGYLPIGEMQPGMHSPPRAKKEDTFSMLALRCELEMQATNDQATQWGTRIFSPRQHRAAPSSVISDGGGLVGVSKNG
ncbi:Mediator of RNA polymerase II transcription subunit 4 [Apiospora arundinis]